jgi:hypothetical protein
MKEEIDSLIEELSAFIPILENEQMNYRELTQNFTDQLLCKKFEKMKHNKELMEVKNFPDKSDDEFIIYRNDCIADKIIKKPARSINCLHIECLELKVLMRWALEYQKCPLCNAKIGIDQIYLDHFYDEELLKYMHDKNIEFLIFNKISKKFRVYDPYYGINSIKYIYEDIRLDNELNDYGMKEYREFNDLLEHL